MDAKPTTPAVTEEPFPPRGAPGPGRRAVPGPDGIRAARAGHPDTPGTATSPASQDPAPAGPPGVPGHPAAAAGPHAPSGPPGASWGPAGRVSAPQPPLPGAPAPRALVRRLVTPVGTLAGVAAAFAYVGTVDPNEPGHYPVCPLLRFTGILCPGCGGLRSAHAFVHGDLGAALGANALAVVGYGLFAVLMAVWLIRTVRGAPMRLAVPPLGWWGVGAVLALFTLVRNLPFGSALAP
ncbi:DUF2752 domain-containing protein [Streptomyces sp. NPDC048338]|uniref:DUF2752 domain-containing protein n=1 Tax=Streptomyces sp. NPDC048338 TaxID=3365536 RepID=UPI00370FE5ED